MVHCYMLVCCCFVWLACFCFCRPANPMTPSGSYMCKSNLHFYVASIKTNCNFYKCSPLIRRHPRTNLSKTQQHEPASLESWSSSNKIKKQSWSACVTPHRTDFSKNRPALYDNSQFECAPEIINSAHLISTLRFCGSVRFQTRPMLRKRKRLLNKRVAQFKLRCYHWTSQPYLLILIYNGKLNEDFVLRPETSATNFWKPIFDKS